MGELIIIIALLPKAAHALAYAAILHTMDLEQLTASLQKLCWSTLPHIRGQSACVGAHFHIYAGTAPVLEHTSTYTRAQRLCWSTHTSTYTRAQRLNNHSRYLNISHWAGLHRNILWNVLYWNELNFYFDLNRSYLSHDYIVWFC